MYRTRMVLHWVLDQNYFCSIDSSPFQNMHVACEHAYSGRTTPPSEHQPSIIRGYVPYSYVHWVLDQNYFCSLETPLTFPEHACRMRACVLRPNKSFGTPPFDHSQQWIIILTSWALLFSITINGYFFKLAKSCVLGRLVMRALQLDCSTKGTSSSWGRQEGPMSLWEMHWNERDLVQYSCMSWGEGLSGDKWSNPSALWWTTHSQP